MDETTPATPETPAPLRQERGLNGYTRARALFLVKQPRKGRSGTYIHEGVVSAATEEDAVLAIRKAIQKGEYLDIRGYAVPLPEVVDFDYEAAIVDHIGLAGEILPGIVSLSLRVAPQEEVDK